MSPADDDISAALPRPPRPAPARREAAIAAAMRRFDGIGEPEPAARPASAAASWARRPYLGALAGAALVAVIALPLAWTAFDEQPYREARKPPAAAGPRPAPPAPAAEPEAPPPPRQVLEPRPSAPAAAHRDPAPVVAPADAAKAGAGPAAASPPLDFAPAPPPAEPAPRAVQAPAGEAEADQVIVTGSRIPRPNLESSSPITVIDSAPAATARRSSAARAERSGDWNACTVEDPRRSLAGCPAAAAEGLERAWKGDWDGASRAFDEAVAAAPRSSDAHLNRALVRRRAGELERALADLDRAVRLSPRKARYYYHRARVLRQLGDADRARADEAKAVELDPLYSAVVPED